MDSIFFAQVAKSTIGGVVTIDYTILWQIFNMFIIYLLIRRYLYKPLVGFVENRKKGIEDDLKYAEQEKQEAQKLKEEYEKSIRAANQEAREILNKATRESEEIIAEGKRQAKQQAEDMIARAQEELELKKEKMFKELKDEVAFISVRIAERIIETKIDAASQRQLVERHLKEVKRVS